MYDILCVNDESMCQFEQNDVDLRWVLHLVVKLLEIEGESNKCWCNVRLYWRIEARCFSMIGSLATHIP